MNPDACPSHSVIFASVAALILAGGPATSAQDHELFDISVSPNPATLHDPVVVNVTDNGSDGCSFLGDPIVTGENVVWVPLSVQCPPPPPTSYPARFLLDPLPPGIWDIQLVSADLPVHPPAVIDSVLLTVTDPRYTVELTPSPATEEDVVVVQVAGVATCPALSTPEIEEGQIRLEVVEAPCPPQPPSHFELEVPLGQLAAGDYRVELFYGRRVAENTLSVLPAGSCVPGETTLCLLRGRFRVEATWATGSGQVGSARAVEVGEGSGVFWFRNPDYGEILIKVIDFCARDNPSFWVYISGATTAGVSIEVTDTESGQVNRYDHPVGRPFETIYHMVAFRTCS